MIGRALAGVCDEHVFVLGTEHSPGLRPWIEEAGRGRPVSIGLLGSDLLVLNRSDYGPFRSRSIPFLFFTTGENPRYHTPQDTADTLDYPKLTAIAEMIHQVVYKALAAPVLPRWQAVPDNPMAEAVTIRNVLQILAKNSERLKIGVAQLFVINNTLETARRHRDSREKSRRRSGPGSSRGPGSSCSPCSKFSHGIPIFDHGLHR